MVTHRKIRNYLVSIPNLMIWFEIKASAAFNMAIEQPEGFPKGSFLEKKTIRRIRFVFSIASAAD
jgi:hypothetical protein